MEKLLVYLNRLKPKWQLTYAEKCGTSLNYLRKAISTKQPLGPLICALLERESAGAVSRRDLRPDDWGDIWPELVNDANPWPPEVEADHEEAA